MACLSIASRYSQHTTGLEMKQLLYKARVMYDLAVYQELRGSSWKGMIRVYCPQNTVWHHAV